MFKWCSWVQFEQRCQGSIFQTRLKVLPVVGAICIGKIDNPVSSRAGKLVKRPILLIWKSGFWFCIPSRIWKQTPRGMNIRWKNHCLVSKFAFSYRKHPRILKKQLWLVYVMITTCQEMPVVLSAAECLPMLGFFLSVVWYSDSWYWRGNSNNAWIRCENSSTAFFCCLLV